jgi:hypothetical protein
LATEAEKEVCAERSGYRQIEDKEVPNVDSV